jgi:predicted acylesterase/phospholipase RssA
LVPFLRDTHFRDGSLAADVPFLHLAESFNVNNLIVSQVNPFVAPFQNRTDRREGSLILYYLLSALDFVKNFVLGEIKHYIQCLSVIGILPLGLQQITDLSQQIYAGTVTIYPHPRI